MGFRSTLITNHYGADLPEWFKEKYKEKFTFPSGTLVSCTDFKMYDGNDFFKDYQKALIENHTLSNSFSVVSAVLGEDGFITKVVMTPDSIKYVWMYESGYHIGVWNQ